ncbi:MAG: hypothetical protein U9Q03_03565 [Patescibacteria group bacterium]|nr:hypothetical protein [Patescibacteria group bacterium]
MEIYTRIAAGIGGLLLVGLMCYGIIRTATNYAVSHDDPQKWKRFAGSWSGAFAMVGSFLLVALVPAFGIFIVAVLPLVEDAMAAFAKDSAGEVSE